VKKQIDALVDALTDPIVVCDPGWPVPERLKGEIQLARLAQLLKKEEGVATDVEALAYLSNASLVAPMRSLVGQTWEPRRWHVRPSCAGACFQR